MIELYHGTRALYREAIFRDGLRPIPVDESGVISYLSSSFDILSDELSFDWHAPCTAYPDSVKCVDEIEFMAIAARNIPRRSANFRYGGVYLTSSINRAGSYADSLPESIRFGFQMHDLLSSHGLTNHTKNFSKILALRDELNSCGPLIIRVNRYDPQKLLNELGTGVATVVAGQQKSFEYKGTLLPSDITEIC
ncbi:hypothetical protein [Xanthomonas vesicatoria]|uniref:hypothetical protein n=2 Tax=Xanthomonas vesicatoria TaxID=56460 RepID=UPI0007320582|nr:hypothetical protein [Xanthomonas vesicatoria]KTF31468.1 hypothetical protein LMG919_19560 [Xanthomonas vesicatoria]MCC8560190.1 hypothetical protein [Xanthomonas vesicatoria]MCC8601120.1 hypothetical protein [Xanthomonas vesicatoria]MCC8608339.1 hypothetical protein [Xanthomonas vesicatoria]MCC8673763.1 hypothetical protein [Xanthomonas vesicatoria]